MIENKNKGSTTDLRGSWNYGFGVVRNGGWVVPDYRQGRHESAGEWPFSWAPFLLFRPDYSG